MVVRYLSHQLHVHFGYSVYRPWSLDGEVWGWIARS